ncbi:hypothetical protein [Dictyobacter formicarum]|uniref:SMODS and SLOG-associating 2TM effector domain-containing protein n=1 Tax=Dictyobacter formicarum TaxID=2778368 RepID=A0ABQ3VQX4_9CHLR|nr:hypothetical protein [Dictyobacter formicarum]GHO87998.1 hypothetical protein KSZ_60040 [Dictyobacter formicarum]
METRSTAGSTSRRQNNESYLPNEGIALEQMYLQSRFEAQCWFFTSLIIAVIGTIFILGTILLFLLFTNTIIVNNSEKWALTIANVVTGVTQQLIISQARSANKRADYYAKELRREANELNVYEIIRVISTSLPEGDERNNLIVRTITDALMHRPAYELQLQSTAKNTPFRQSTSKRSNI